MKAYIVTFFIVFMMLFGVSVYHKETVEHYCDYNAMKKFNCPKN